eukprot:4079816-Amphidinium_carterae.1
MVSLSSKAREDAAAAMLEALSAGITLGTNHLPTATFQEQQVQASRRPPLSILSRPQKRSKVILRDAATVEPLLALIDPLLRDEAYRRYEGRSESQRPKTLGPTAHPWKI